jgi:Trk K+ transport system NAD-binding subunit
MMFGHVETVQERFEHLVKIRTVQAKKPADAKGFIAFIPWTFQDVDTLLAKIRGVHNLTSADAEIVEFVAKEGSLITRRKVKDLDLPSEANIGGIVRAGEGLLVNGETQIISGDVVVVFCKSHVIRHLERFFK